MRRLFVGLTLVAGIACSDTLPGELPIGGDFTLTDQHGQPFSSTSLRGQVTLVFFGYTFCPDACPTTLSKLTAVMRRLGNDAERVKVVYISVDPKRDTPEVMKAHLDMFALDAVGLTGTQDQVDRVAKQYGVFHEAEDVDSAAGYLIAHTTSVFALDTEGRARELLRYNDSVDEMVTKVRRLL